MNVEAMLERALADPHPLYTMDGVKRAIREKRAQLWRNDGAVLVTEVDDYPDARQRVLTAWLGAGDKDALMALRADVEGYGKRLCVNQFHVTGRDGWIKLFAPHGYEPYARVIRKVL